MEYKKEIRRNDAGWEGLLAEPLLVLFCLRGTSVWVLRYRRDLLQYRILVCIPWCSY